MTKAERVIAAYYCSDLKLPGNRCKDCPYGYGYIDDSGDYCFWWCNDEQMEKDMIDILSSLVGPKTVQELKKMVKERIADGYRQRN